MSQGGDDQVEVQTVFTVEDQDYADRMKEMKQDADQLTAAADKTSAALASVHAPAPKTPEHGGEGVGHGGESRGGHGGTLSRDEQEEYALAHAERKARRQRMLIEKTEQQKGQVLHRAAEMALMAVVGEENKMASALAKGSATVESVGLGFVGFGGTLGKVGGVLAKFGEVGAIASLALEGTTALLESLDVDVEGLEHSAVQAAKGLLGIAGRAHKTASEMGFASEADRKAAEEIEKRQTAESALRGFLKEYSDQLQTLARAKFGGSQEQYEDMLRQLTEQGRREYKSMQGISFADAMAKVEEQMRATSEYYRMQQTNEARLEKMEEDLVKGGQLTAIQYQATAQQMAEHYAQAQKLAEAELERGHIAREETAAFAAGLVAQAEKHGAIQNEIAAMRENEDRQVQMADAVKQYTKLLHVVSPKASVDAISRMNHSMLDLAGQAAEALKGMGAIKGTGAEMDELLTQFKNAASEKQNRVFDFRYSRFDIRQAFSDMDPDRIAIAFSNDLAALGERRVQSMFSPLFGV